MFGAVLLFVVPCLVCYVYGVVETTLLQRDDTTSGPRDDAKKTSPVKDAIGNAMIRVMLFVIFCWGMMVLEMVNFGGDLGGAWFVLWAIAIYAAWLVGLAHGRHLRKQWEEESHRHTAAH